ncbi:MAG: dTDP-4-dehydrorhamnose reductase [bacterium]|nr:dTDP-4-dehydrorhamnose reductase [bacterium]
MKVLTLGSQGQLGQDIAKVLEEENISCFAAARNDADITSRAEIENLLDKEKPDIVINCAAFHDPNTCEEEPDKAMEVNAFAVAQLAGLCSVRKSVLMHISTDYVFDGRKIEGYTEEDNPSPILWYGRSKLAGEWSALANNNKTFVVRVQSLYGIAGPRSKKMNFVDLMLKLADERPEINVDQCRMAPTWTFPLAKNLVSLMQSEKYGLYHMSCNKQTTWFEFAKAIMRLADKDTVINPVANDFFPRNFDRPENTFLQNKRLQDSGLDIMPDWEDALKDYLKLKALD